MLNAADTLVAQMAEYCDGEVMYFARDLSLLVEHRQQGGRCVSVRDGKVVLCTADQEQNLIELTRILVLGDELDPHLLDNVLAAIAVAWALQVAPALMRAGLETYTLQPLIA